MTPGLVQDQANSNFYSTKEGDKMEKHNSWEAMLGAAALGILTALGAAILLGWQKAKAARSRTKH